MWHVHLARVLERGRPLWVKFILSRETVPAKAPSRKEKPQSKKLPGVRPPSMKFKAALKVHQHLFLRRLNRGAPLIRQEIDC